MHKKEMNILGIACRTSNAKAIQDGDIAKHWQRFIQENIAVKIPNKASEEIIALYCEYESDHNGHYTLILGCEVNLLGKIPEGLVAKTIPASKYSVFTSKGKSIFETWGRVWKTPLNRTFVGDFELYRSPTDAQIFIGIKD